mmetsp:Transcript_5086/g.17117  ORF Transcript_5086/g.17117 Transcript_5086/m.17117 type:complete len:295 (+) Transcript_5086:71-955(+)
MRCSLSSAALVVGLASVASGLTGSTAGRRVGGPRPAGGATRGLAAGQDGAACHGRPCVVFPGGGIFYYWQAGAATYLAENYDVSRLELVGASAGALTSTLLACGVDFNAATEEALRLSRAANLWDRPLGLVGVWGSLLRTWLEEVLPADAHERLDDRVFLTVTAVPSLRQELVTTFRDKEDVVQANLASTHVPWLMDGKPYTKWRGRRVLDGSLWYFVRKSQRAVTVPPDVSPVYLDYGEHEEFMRGMQNGAFDLVDPEALWVMMEAGYSYMQAQDQAGQLLRPLDGLRLGRTA